MSSSRWTRISDLFAQASDLPAHERREWLSRACDDEGVRLEVEALLETYDADPGFLEQSADVAPAMHRAGDALVGRVLGRYRLVRQVGRGGMGVVYEAERDDQEFDRRAAVKVLPAWSASVHGERFGLERRVLAGLDHPGIARLIDAGTTDDGVQYFVMEYVDGRPIDAYCRERALPVRRRVALLEQVLRAVAYAHQQLVIHRDVKPANVLVTDDGSPKLLDFGIAALVSADDGASLGTTRTGQHSFTLDFASPEQVRGERVTTASDVYSLGALAYLVLSGRHPLALGGLSPLEAMRTVCEADPPPMSAVADATAARQLRGDLDRVVARALARNPRERYPTVTALGDDLRAWMEGRPVTATPPTLGYRGRRFVARHKALVAAAAAVVLALAAGGVATAWQARVARQERDKAERRFDQVREFSRSLLFDVHRALADVPGATASRRLLLDRAVQFLDGLAADAGEDDALGMELAAGYRELAHVQGTQFSENLGDTAAAAQSLDKASTLLARVRSRRPDDFDALVLAIFVAHDQAAVLLERGEKAAAPERLAHRESLLRELEQRHPGNRRATAVLAEGYSDVGLAKIDLQDFAGAEQAYRDALRLFDQLRPDERTAPRIEAHAFALKRLGAVLLRAGSLDESEQRYRQALALDEEALGLAPDRPRIEYSMTFTLSDLGLVLSRRERWRDASALWERALRIRQAAADADPRNTRALSGVSTLRGRLGLAAMAERDFAGAAAHYRQELEIRERLVTIQGPLPGRVAERAWARLNLARALFERAAATPRDSDRSKWLAEAHALVARTSPDEGQASVTAGSDPGFRELHAALLARAAQ